MWIHSVIIFHPNGSNALSLKKTRQSFDTCGQYRGISCNGRRSMTLNETRQYKEITVGIALEGEDCNLVTIQVDIILDSLVLPDSNC